MSTTRESTIQSAILEYINALPGCRAVNVHQSARQGGEPDISGSCQGRAIKLEVKRPGEAPTKRQRAILRKWSETGAITAVVTSIEDVRAVLNEEGVL